MAWKRIAYAVILIASAAAFVVTDSAVALFVMICLVAIPLTSLASLIVSKHRVKFDFSARESCIRGGAIQLDIKVGVHPRFLVGSVRVTADIENTTFGKTERKNFSFQDVSYTPHTYDFVSGDSGRIRIKIKSIKIIDIFGIFSVTVPCAKFAESFVSPMLYDDVKVRLAMNATTSLSGETSVPQRGQDPTEIFDIRDYAAGDSLKSVHWKLSSKFDSLKTKEFGSTDDRKTLILVDLSREKNGIAATDLQLNSVLDVAVSVSNSLKSEGYAHRVGWFDEGVFFSAEVADNGTFVQMVNELMSIKIKDGNAEVMFYLSRAPECVGFTKIILVAPSVGFDDLNATVGADITALSVGKDSATINEHGIKIIRIPCDDVCAALADCVL